MDNKEACEIIGKIKPNDNFRCLKRCEALMQAMTVLEAADKYAWHDLKKNPEDLPQDQQKRLVVTQTKAGSTNYVLAYYCQSLKTWASGMNNNVIAWRDIEPFEVKADESKNK